jgi:hypothetical protein
LASDSSRFLRWSYREMAIEKLNPMMRPSQDGGHDNAEIFALILFQVPAPLTTTDSASSRHSGRYLVNQALAESSEQHEEQKSDISRNSTYGSA